MTRPTIASVKAEARALRQTLQARGDKVSHAQCLEQIAHAHGARDWNTLHARLSKETARGELAPGDRVKGFYLGQPFSGQVVELSGPAEGRRIELVLDQAIDTVRFDGFSNWRKRIRGTIGQNGRSPDVTSDGTPHLVVEKAEP